MSTTSITEKAAAKGAKGKPGNAPKDGEEEAGAKGGKKKLIIIAAPVALILIGAAVWFFLLRGGGEEKAEPAPLPGVVVRMDPISINLAGGHYLKLGIALQATIDAHEEPEGSHAQDLAVAMLSGRTVEELADGAAREAIKAELKTEVTESYEHSVMDVWFYEFVTQ
jgi:flagellar FliL protein